MRPRVVLSRIGEGVPWLLAAFVLALRFWRPGETVYIYDESLFQLKIDEAFAAHELPLSSFRGSSIPLPYGAGGLWFYMVPRLFTWHPVPIILFHITVQTLAAAVLLLTLRRAYGDESARWCALLVATSPLVFFLARHPWDNTLLMPVSALVLYGLQRLAAGASPWRVAVGLGLLCGYALNVHPMFGPVAMAAGLTLGLFELRRYGGRSWRAWGPVVLFGVVALLMLVPYLVEARRIVLAENSFDHATVTKRWGDGRNLWWLFLRTTIFSSLFGARIYLDSVRDQLAAFSGALPAYFFRVDLFGWFGKLAAWIMAFGTIFSFVRGRPVADPLRWFAALSFVLVLLVYQYLNIPTAPHYFNPIWWFVFLGIAQAIPQLRGLLWKRLFLGTLALTAAANFLYDAEALAFIHANQGARSMQMSVVVQEQLRMYAELCRWARDHGRPEVRVDYTDAQLGQPAFDFLTRHIPDCQGIRFVAGKALANPDFFLHHPHDSSTKANLEAEPASR